MKAQSEALPIGPIKGRHWQRSMTRLTRTTSHKGTRCWSSTDTSPEAFLVGHQHLITADHSALMATLLPVKYQQHPQSFGSLLAELTACSSRLSWSFFLATPSGVYSPKPPLLPLLILFIVLCSLQLPILVKKARTVCSKVTTECLLHRSQKNRWRTSPQKHAVDPPLTQSLQLLLQPIYI